MDPPRPRFWRAATAVLMVFGLQSGAAAPSDEQDVPNELALRALALVNVPYRYGGRTPAGFDCSGFVGYVFSQTAGLALPRRSEEIMRFGEPLAAAQLSAGDLVFFNTLGRPYSHVGIYLGDDRFVHAPARRGRVRVERLTDAYWAARFSGARRVLTVGGSVTVSAAMAGPAVTPVPAPGASVPEYPAWP